MVLVVEGPSGGPVVFCLVLVFCCFLVVLGYG